MRVKEEDCSEDVCVCVCVCPGCSPYLLWAELVGAAHEVCAEQREGDGVARLRGQLQTLLEHFLKRPAVEATGDRRSTSHETNYT